MTFKSVFGIRHILAYARMDIRWWSLYTNAWSGIQLLDIAHTTVQHLYGHKWFQGPWWHLWQPVVLVQIPPPFQAL